MTWNDLRRTLSPWLVEGGVSDTVIAKLLGHADTTMLHRVYGKPRDEAVSSLLARQTSGLPAVRLPVRVAYVSPSDRALPRPKAPLASVRNHYFAVGRAGLEPATYGLKVLRLIPRTTVKIGPIATRTKALYDWCTCRSVS